MPVSAAHCEEGHKAGVGGVRRFPCCPLHAHACAYQHVRGRGIPLLGGSNGGDVGDDRPQFPFVGPGSPPPPSLLPGACLLLLLCGHHVPASSEREDPSLSPAGRFRSLIRCLFRVYFVLWCPFPMGLGVSGLAHRVLGVWCVRCVVQLLVLLWVSHFRCRFEGRVANPIRWLVTGDVRIRQWSCSIP